MYQAPIKNGSFFPRSQIKRSQCWNFDYQFLRRPRGILSWRKYRITRGLVLTRPSVDREYFYFYFIPT
jgi:hypothetical protein